VHSGVDSNLVCGYGSEVGDDIRCMEITETSIYQQIGGSLEVRKEQLERELGQLATKGTNGEDTWKTSFVDFGRGDDENAAEIATYADSLSLEKALEKELRDVVNALSRIAAGSYGTCRYCNEPIPEKRLLARPTSSSCVACKQEKKKSTA
jgi:DnaK suppressor protein